MGLESDSTHCQVGKEFIILVHKVGVLCAWHTVAAQLPKISLMATQEYVPVENTAVGAVIQTFVNNPFRDRELAGYR